MSSNKALQTADTSIPSVTASTDDDSNDDEDAAKNKYDYQETPFIAVKQYPYIKDTPAFIKTLKLNCHIYLTRAVQKHTAINYFKKLSIFGGKNEVYLIEIDFHDGAMAEYPWKKQFIFDNNGRLLKLLNEVKLESDTILSSCNPFLFGLSATSKGNGKHEVFRLTKDTVEQVYDGFLGTKPQTYSTGYFNSVTEPNELNHQFKDVNNDGFNDILFYGKLRYSLIDLGYHDTTIRVKYIFLYHPSSGHFVEKEDYSKKYEFIYGNTK